MLFQSAPVLQLISVLSIMIAMFSFAFFYRNRFEKNFEENKRLRGDETTDQIAPPSQTVVMIAGSSDLSEVTAVLIEHHTSVFQHINRMANAMWILV